MTVKEIRNILWSNPHRLNDEHVEYLLERIDHLVERCEELDIDNKKLRADSMQHSQAMMGNMPGLLLNKPEIFAKG